jgi:outer membrane protein
MKRFLFIGIAGLFLLTLMVSPLFAAENFKVGIVYMFKVLNESEAGKRAKTDLELLIKSKQSALEEKGKAIEKLKAEMEKQASIISPEARKAKEDEMERLRRDSQRMIDDSNVELQKRQRDIESAIVKEIIEVVNKIAQEEKYSLILELGQAGVMFSDKPTDITDKVIKKYNESKVKSKK